MNLAADNRWVTVARLGRAWGNRGGLTATALSSRPERFHELREVFLFRGDAPVEIARCEVESVRQHAGGWIFKFRGVDTISQAEALAHAEVRIPLEERAELPAGEHYLSELIGCEVRERASGTSLGMVTGWQETGGPGLLEVGDKLLIPFVRSICVEIDTRAKCILVDLPEGLKDLNQP